MNKEAPEDSKKPTPLRSLSSLVGVKAKKRPYGPVAAVLLTVVVFLGSQLFGAIFVAYFISIGTGIAYEAAVENLTQSTFQQFLYSLVAGGLALYFTWRLVQRRKLGLEYLGLHRKPAFKDFTSAVVVGVIYFFVLIFMVGVIDKLIPGINTAQEQEIGFEQAKAGLELALVFISLAVLPPIVEEVMIRGFLYKGLSSKLPKIFAAMVASVLFGIAHLQLGGSAPPLWIAAIDTAILSMFLIYLREKTGALWASIILHAIKNSLAFMFLFVVK